MNGKHSWITLLTLSLSLFACGGGGGDDDSDDDDDDNSGPGVTEVSGSHRVLAFNDLGMHCADLDYSTFVILPPFNVIHSQVIERGNPPKLLDDNSVEVSYLATSDPSGSINTTSQNLAGSVNKTNFWSINPNSGNSYVFDLFGDNPVPDEGLVFGQNMPGILNPYSANDPQLFNEFNRSKGWFSAEGIPILPVDDNGQPNAYPLMRVTAQQVGSETALATLDVVLPVASEADCQNCHAAGEIAAPITSEIPYLIPDDINDSNAVLQAAKENILLLHDAEHATNLVASKPVLCAACHYSAALDLSGSGPAGSQLGNDTMSEVMHRHHGQLTDETSGEPIFPSNGDLEETCYQCHPGKVTQCLRGAMGGAGIECADCHGSMLAVGQETRTPWLDEPRCESCHTGDATSHLGTSLRLSQAWEDNIDTATPRIATNKRFAENDLTLYRNSLGHGGVACEGCHGSTHAIWPNANEASNDNLASIQLQGHVGTISDCSTCHTSLPLTTSGPHGMHNVNSRGWNLDHEDFYKDNPSSCQSCHGVNLQGTVLSQAADDRNYLRDDDGERTIFVAKGTQVSCTLCHEYPEEDDD
ncbi:MAG: cytochrome C [Candidatus Thiodiazotropha sp. 6PLUC2]